MANGIKIGRRSKSPSNRMKEIAIQKMAGRVIVIDPAPAPAPAPHDAALGPWFQAGLLGELATDIAGRALVLYWTLVQRWPLAGHRYLMGNQEPLRQAI